jgi:hypothetical protein
MADFDLLIRGGAVIDGTGADERIADIAVSNKYTAQYSYFCDLLLALLFLAQADLSCLLLSLLSLFHHFLISISLHLALIWSNVGKLKSIC